MVASKASKSGRTRVATVRTNSPRMKAWMAGEIKPEELTDDEVFKMQLMDSDGHFRGRPPGMIPRDLALAFRSEAQKRLQGWFIEQVPDAMRAYREIMMARTLAPGDTAKLRAAEGVFERVIGKVTANMEVHSTVEVKTYEDVLDEVLVEVPDPD